MEKNEKSSEISQLTATLEKIYKRQTFSRAFLAGVLSGLGSAVGATLVFALLIYLLSKVNLIPIVGDWLGQVFSQALGNIPQR